MGRRNLSISFPSRVEGWLDVCGKSTMYFLFKVFNLNWLSIEIERFGVEKTYLKPDAAGDIFYQLFSFGILITQIMG